MADNCEPRKIDSNRTGLAFAETICGRLPTVALDGFDPTWFELEPNSYDEYGGSITTTARSPISASRQRKKGVVTDLSAGGGFNMDFTRSNHNRLLQGFFFAAMREKASTAPLNGDAVEVLGAVAADDTFTAADGLDVFRVGQLIKVSGFLNAANNGVMLTNSVIPGAIGVTSPLADETAPDGVVIKAVGWQLTTGAANIVLVGNVPQLVMPTPAVAAEGTITITTAAADDTVTIGGIEYTFVAAIDAPYEVLIGADATATAANLAASINGGVLNTPANPRVFAEAALGVVTLTATVPGANGNDIALAEDGAAIAVSGAELTGGTGFSFNETGLIVGEWVYLGGDLLANRFANNVGYARIGGITDGVLTFDKTTWVPVAETGTGKTVHLFTGDTLRNEKDEELIETRYVEFERTLGKDADGVQAEYLTRSVANEFTLNVPLPEGEDAKLNADLTFVSGDAEQRTGLEGRKLGTHIPAPGEDAINTASNVVRIRMAIIDPATSRPTPLFAYVVEGNISINNNVTPAKAIGVLGSYDVNVGDFDAGGEVTAVFQTVEATRAVRNNADVTLDFISAAENAGFVWDYPLLTLGGGGITVEPGTEIRVPLELMGAENPLGYTLLYTNWAYLPTLAMPKANTEY